MALRLRLTRISNSFTPLAEAKCKATVAAELAQPVTISVHLTTRANWSFSTEFKEIRKEWKARKKEEENQRKADEERQRSAAQANPVDGQAPDPAQAPSAQNYPPGVRQLPPIGYGPAGAQAPGPYPGAVDPMYQQGNGQMYQQYPHSPYGQGQQMYHQRHTPVLGRSEVDADAARRS